MCAATVAGLGAALAAATPAAADTSIAPGDYVQGNAARMTFHITNSNPTTSLKTIEVRMPEKFPVAEIYPMSHDGWAPDQIMTKIDGALIGLHGGTTSEVVSKVIWTAIAGNELKPGASMDLQLSMYSLPLTGTFTVGVVETYSDGTVTGPAASITLAPPVASGQEAADTGAAPDTATDTSGESKGSNLFWMFGLLVLIGAVTAFALVRQRRGEPVAADDSAEDEDDEPAPVAKKAVAKKAVAKKSTTKSAAPALRKSAPKSESARRRERASL